MSFSLLSMASRSSSGSGNPSSIYISDDIHENYSNRCIYELQLWKERELPQHEFVVLYMGKGSRQKYYRLDRRAASKTSLKSKIQGCPVLDTITPLSTDAYARLYEGADCRISVSFRSRDSEPGLHTIFTICKAIREDRSARKYTLEKYNCYFFARTLTLHITRLFLLRQYCRIYNARNNFDSLSVRDIDRIANRTMEKTPTRDPCMTIKFGTLDDGHNYKDLRLRIRQMNKAQGDTVTQWGRDGVGAYNSLNKKMEEIWCRVYSLSEGGPAFRWLADFTSVVVDKLRA